MPLSVTLCLHKRLLLPILALCLGFCFLAKGQDTEPPYVLAVDPPAGSALTYIDHIVVTFNEPVFNLFAEDLYLNGAPARILTQYGNSYCFSNLPPISGGQIFVSFRTSHAILDAAENVFDPAAAGNSWNYFIVDEQPPTLAKVLPVPGATVTRLDTVEVLFSEAVSGVTADDLLINGAPAISVIGYGLGPYRFTFPQPAVGPVQFSWSTNAAILDLAKNPNPFVGGTWSNLLVDPQSLGQVVINEFLANNITSLTNEFGETEDWIELYNPGGIPVNLLGWSLSDDKNSPGLWSFPDITLHPGEYLVVFADGLDLKSSTNTHLHTNFRLNDQGDYLALCNADFPPTPIFGFDPLFPEQRPDYSYGLSTNGSWSYLAPTPGRPNPASSISGLTPLPHLNTSAGIYDQPFTLMASCELPEATLRYTTDGSIPTEANGLLYTQPLVISNTTVFRIAAFAPARLPSRVLTHTYLFLDRVLRQTNAPPGYPTGTNAWCNDYAADYEMDPEIVTNNTASVRSSLLALPTLAVSMKISDLFSTNNGIYSNPFIGDPERSLWERPCSVELLLTNGETAFQVDCGIRIQGNASRIPQKTPKHSFRLLFKGAYGPGRLIYPVFPDSPVQSFNSLVLHSEYNNSWLHENPYERKRGSKVRDAWAKKTFSAMNGISGHSRPFHLYLNGLYWGLYDFGERVDAEFAASYLGGTPQEWDAMASNPTQPIDGNQNAYDTLVGIGGGYDMSQPTNYLLLQQHLDLPVFLDYMILNFYGANKDWYANGNWNAIHRRAPGETFKYVPWDAEMICVSNLDNQVISLDLPSGLHTNLFNSPQYRMDFADRVHKYCFNNGLLTPGPAAERWMQIAAGVGPGMLAESARWGDFRKDVYKYGGKLTDFELYTTNRHWWPEIQRMQTNYFPARTEIFLGQLRAAGLYPNIAAPVFTPRGGHVALGSSLSMSSSNTVYYTLNGEDPRLPFTGAIAPAALTYTGAVTIASSLHVKARAFDGTNWSALNEALFQPPRLGSPLIFTEIMYNPVGGDAYEFLELYNRSTDALDVSGWSFHGIDFTFKVGTILQPGQVIVLANSVDLVGFSNRYPQLTVFGYFSDKIDNAGEYLALLDPSGAPQVTVDFSDGNGWPRLADGMGYSLELVDPLGDPNAASNWRATSYNGTPGLAAFGNAPGSLEPDPFPICLNEIMARNTGAVTNDGTTPDWIEVFNHSTNTIDLTDWSLTDDSNERKFVFPANTLIPPQGYVLVWCDTYFTQPGLHAGFGLASGETVSLYNPTNARADAITLGVQLANYSVGRIGSQWVLTLPTPASNNVAALLASPTNLCINEWLANSAPGHSDWLELYNAAPYPVSLTGLFLTQSNKVHQIRSLSFIPANGFLQLFADEQTGPDHLNFKLPAAGSLLTLCDPASNPIDQVSYQNLAETISQGRYPNGSPNIINFPTSPSPGASNYLPSASTPILNEIMARNRGAVTNTSGRAADWVEIYNPLPSYQNLGNYRLSTSSGDPGQWFIPPGAFLPPYGYLVIWFDRGHLPSFTIESELNTGRALNGDGDELYLFNPSGALVDVVKFGPQAANYSIGRSGTNWTLLASPTPGWSNAGPAVLGNPTNLRFNEWLAQPAYDQDPFLELYNSSLLPIQLSGLFLTDQLSLPSLTKFQIGPLTYVAPRDFADFKADANRSKGPNHVNFTLDPNGGALRLSSPTLDLIDVLYFGVQPQGASQGYLFEGSTILSSFPCPTPGSSNALGSSIIIFEQPQPQTQTVLAGATVLFNVQAQGGDLLTYQWFWGESPVSQGANPTLVLTNIQESNSGDYHVHVANACNFVSSRTVHLTVYGPPVIIRPPQSATNALGESVTFTVLYTSSTPAAFQWRFNNQDLPSATNATLRLDHLTFANAGFYSVIITNMAGSTPSTPAKLVVTGPISVLNPYLLNSNFLFSIQGPLFQTYTLQRSGMPLLHNWLDVGMFTLTNYAQIFSVPTPTNSNSGFYRLRVD